MSSKPKNVDIWMIRDNLRASYETRVERHQDTLNCIDSLKGLGSVRRAKPSKISSISRSRAIKGEDKKV